MKRFYFTDNVVKTSKTYGWQMRECTIYQLKNNDLHNVGSVIYNTASTMGNTSEVNKYLLDNKYIPKTWSITSYGEKVNYYYHNDKYKIKELR